MRYLPPLLLSIALVASATRDPFWPIGYQPPSQVVEAVPEAPDPEPPSPEPPPPPPPPVTAAEWQAATAAINISGVTRTTHADTGETRALAMINRRHYTDGDTLCVTNQNIRFVWRVKPIKGLDVKLERIEAERLDHEVAPPPHKDRSQQ